MCHWYSLQLYSHHQMTTETQLYTPGLINSLVFPSTHLIGPISKFGTLTRKTNEWEKVYHCAPISSEIPFHAEGRHPRSLMGKNFRSYLLDLRNTSTPFKGVRKALVDTLLDGYETARYGTGVSEVPLFL